ncbi:DUF2793 domain-containing protein [Oceanicella actignis]|uniref:DUF2793 domain-containing protein n=1 Tax=Oceanicella actignis TaxID=1189325 RepID=UPI0012521472|nr:DUF2793 domain-containing protein [Oceanicella actignis]TYO91414.1 uncharacterized protein DUF2793 [Oceanicella actignis]
MSQTTHLALPYILAAQAQKHVTHNEALRILDGLVQLSVIDRDLTDPPASPADGDRYIVAAGATGDWSGWDLNVALWTDGAWMRLPPRIGWRAWVEDEGLLLVHDGTTWTPAGGLLAALGDVDVSSAADGDGLLYDSATGTWVAGPVATTSPYDVRVAFSAAPAADEVIDTIAIPRDWILPANLAGSSGAVGAAPAAQFVLSVRDDGIEVAQISVATDGTITTTTTGGAGLTVAAGSLVTIVAPSTADAQIANLTFTIAGEAS